QTTRYEIVYRIRTKGTQVFVNEEFVGTIDPSGMFYREADRLVLGKVDRSESIRTKVYVGEARVGSLMIPQEKSVVSPRAFDMDEKLDPKAHLLFMVQAIHEVILLLNR
ncbi:MAG: hypothetical protein KDC80_14505, partial [Saprospiraceae bacterium]|nr:hypothetical protein [Saprospiraceae bacterium]